MKNEAQRPRAPDHICFLAVVLALAACATTPVSHMAVRAETHEAEQDDAAVAAGMRIVELQCVSCHAVRSSDASRHPQAPPLRTLAERYPVTGLAEAFALGIMTGHPDMPEFRLSRAQVETIVAYLESIQTRQGAQLEGGQGRRAALVVGITGVGAAGANQGEAAYGLY